MRIVRYDTQDGKKPKYGWLLDDKVGEIGGNLYGRYRRNEAQTPLSEVKLLPPCEPSKIVCVGRNYVEHAKELGNEVPKVPLIFLKPPSSIIGNGEAILLQTQSAQVEHEAELVIVIGKRGKNVTAENARKYILGYTVGNDVTARDLQKTDGQWTRAKGFDTFCPFGPAVVTGLDPASLTVRTVLDGQVRQDYPISDMRFSVAELVSMISHDMTLLPGDLILCGTSVGVGSMKPGSQVSVEIDGIGALTNPVE